ncbi:MAG: glycosyltransferase family 2 protein [Bryobacteraceae bacterium]
MTDCPLVSVVTASYNMGEFLRETIDSVLSQDYPHIEYIVMDGGSTDGTLEVLEGYRGRIIFHSAPDGGAADAINRGMELARGSIIAYLHADDTYLPGAVSEVVRQFVEHPTTDIVYGEGYWVDVKGAILRRYPTRPFDRAVLARECFICQPASFMRRSTFEIAGGLDASLQYTFDFDFWIRASPWAEFRHIDAYLATSRMHPRNKTVGQRREVLRETLRLLKMRYGYVPFSWIHAYCCYRIDGRDQFYQALRPSLLKYLVSLPVGLHHNTDRPLRYILEWADAISWGGFVRLCKRAVRFGG